MKERPKNILTFVGALFVSYLAFEFILWRNLLTEVPLTLHTTLGRLQYLAQTSKNSVIPERYVLILGDSIAEGLGDHLMRVVVERKPRYAVAHHLQDKIGRDVISFGVRGGYPSDTYVFQSHRNWDGINIYAGIALEQPKDIVVLYSEGTDINDEMANIRFWLPADIDRSRLMDTDYVAKLMTRYVADGKKLARRRWHAGRNGHMFDTIMKLTKLFVYNLKTESDHLLTDNDPQFRLGRAYNQDWSRYEGSDVRVLVGGVSKPYPKHTVESFAFHDDAEIAQATLFFDAAVGELRKQFPISNIWIVYVPTPINSYRLLKDAVSLRDRIRFTDTDKVGPPTRFSRAHLEDLSDRVCQRIRTGSLAKGARFIDARAGLRKVAADQGYIHGPTDPGHLNERGYKALAAIIARGMKDTSAHACATIAGTGAAAQGS